MSENSTINEINHIKLQKMAFIYNALEDGWAINKKNNCYIFKKNHEGKKEVYLDDYLRRFMKDNFKLENLFS